MKMESINQHQVDQMWPNNKQIFMRFDFHKHGSKSEMLVSENQQKPSFHAQIARIYIYSHFIDKQSLIMHNITAI